MALVVLLASLVGCDNSAANALRTCEGGNTEACYKDGMNAIAAAQPKFGDARKAFASACRPSIGSAPSSVSKHHPMACNELGILVRDAKGGPKDVPRAIELFEIACKDGIDRACVDLGALLWSDDPELDPEADRAVVLFESTCARIDLKNLPEVGPHPLAEACDRLGHAWRTGIGVEPPVKDDTKAADNYQRACEANYAPGCVSAGHLAQSKKRRDDVEKAAQFYERACRLDARQGCFDLAELHAHKALPEATDDKAVEFYKKSCAIDPTRGCFEAGAMMEEGRVKFGEGEIASLYNQACEHGHTEACARRAIKR